MRKGVLQELIEDAKQDKKYIYQRYNGFITKYIDDGKYYIDCESGIGIKKDEHLMLGKVSENIIDLIEIGDYVNGHRIVDEIYVEDDNNLYFEIEGGFNSAQYIGEKDIKTILTKELYEANCYTVGGEEQ